MVWFVLLTKFFYNLEHSFEKLNQIRTDPKWCFKTFLKISLNMAVLFWYFFYKYQVKFWIDQLLIIGTCSLTSKWQNWCQDVLLSFLHSVELSNKLTEKNCFFCILSPFCCRSDHIDNNISHRKDLGDLLSSHFHFPWRFWLNNAWFIIRIKERHAQKMSHSSSIKSC